MADNTFQYFLNQKRHIAVVSFLGDCSVAAAPVLEKCWKELEGIECPQIVLNFSGVTAISPELDPFLVRLQVGIRENNKELEVCGLSALMKKRLVEAGIVRSYEISGSLVEALQKIVAKTTGGK